MLLEPRNRCSHRLLAGLVGGSTRTHQPPQLNLGAHLAAQGPHCVLIQCRFAQRLARLAGFALEGQLLAPSFQLLGDRVERETV
jgi:hypothetical protein